MAGNSETVLVIDDEPIDTETMRRILEAHGFRVSTGYGYDDALRLFEKQKPNLLIVDIALPGRNGVEIASELWKRKPDLKVLFVSGYVGAEVMRFYGMPPADVHFLRKPFGADEFLRRVEAVLKSPRHIPARWPG